MGFLEGVMKARGSQTKCRVHPPSHKVKCERGLDTKSIFTNNEATNARARPQTTSHLRSPYVSKFLITHLLCHWGNIKNLMKNIHQNAIKYLTYLVLNKRKLENKQTTISPP